MGQVEDLDIGALEGGWTFRNSVKAAKRTYLVSEVTTAYVLIMEPEGSCLSLSPKGGNIYLVQKQAVEYVAKDCANSISVTAADLFERRRTKRHKRYEVCAR